MESEIVSVALSEGPEWLDTNVIVAGTADGSIRMWSLVPKPVDDSGTTAFDATSTEERPSYAFVLRWERKSAHSCPIVRILLSPNEAEMFTGDESGEILNWSII